MTRAEIACGPDHAIDFSSLQTGPVFQVHPPVFIAPSKIVIVPGVFLEDGTHIMEQQRETE